MRPEPGLVWAPDIMQQLLEVYNQGYDDCLKLFRPQR